MGLGPSSDGCELVQVAQSDASELHNMAQRPAKRQELNQEARAKVTANVTKALATGPHTLPSAVAQRVVAAVDVWAVQSCTDQAAYNLVMREVAASMRKGRAHLSSFLRSKGVSVRLEGECAAESPRPLSHSRYQCMH
jgi:hypothetical protein